MLISCIHLCISKDYPQALDSQKLFAELEEGTTLQATAEEVRQAWEFAVWWAYGCHRCAFALIICVISFPYCNI